MTDTPVRLLRNVKSLHARRYEIGAVLANFIATVAATAWGVLGIFPWNWWAFPLLLVSLALIALGAIWANKDRERYEKLQQDLDKAEESSSQRGEALNTAFVTLMRVLAQECQAHEPTNRVSIYFATPESFVMIARYSSDPLKDAHGRGTYPISEGTIGAAWHEKNGLFLASFPSDEDEWVDRHMSKYGFSEKDARDVFRRMPSREVGAVRMEDEHKRGFGVLVYESVEEDGIKMKTLESTRRRGTFRALSELTARWAHQTEQGVANEVQIMDKTVARNWQPSKSAGKKKSQHP